MYLFHINSLIAALVLFGLVVAAPVPQDDDVGVGVGVDLPIGVGLGGRKD